MGMDVKERGRLVESADGGAVAPGSDPPLWRTASAELVGTALLVALGCMPVCCSQSNHLTQAFTFPLVVLAIVQSFDHVSGAFLNPAVAIASALSGRIHWLSCAVFVICECVGATAGAGVLLALVPDHDNTLCLTLPAEHLSLFKAVAIEALLTGVLVLANCAAWDPRTSRLHDSWPLKVALIVCALSLAGGHLTGASMNPARSLGPVIWTRQWTNHWVYWLGPLFGSCVTTLVYSLLWHPHSYTRHSHSHNTKSRTHSHTSA